MLTADAPVEVGPRELHVTVTTASPTGGLYTAPGDTTSDAQTFTVPAIPFSTWGNAAPGAMRVWLPTQT